MIFIFHIRPFWARWSPLYVRISIFLVNPENLECACIYIFVSTCVFYNYPGDAQDSRGIFVTRAREIVRSYVATSGTRACAWGHISHARTCHGVCTQLVFIILSGVLVHRQLDIGRGARSSICMASHATLPIKPFEIYLRNDTCTAYLL